MSFNIIRNNNETRMDDNALDVVMLLAHYWGSMGFEVDNIIKHNQKLIDMALEFEYTAWKNVAITDDYHRLIEAYADLKFNHLMGVGLEMQIEDYNELIEDYDLYEIEGVNPFRICYHLTKLESEKYKSEDYIKEHIDSIILELKENLDYYDIETFYKNIRDRIGKLQRGQ